MKISELLNEAPPGTRQPATSWLGKKIEKFAGMKSDFDMNRAVSKAYRFWVDHVGKMQDNGYDMNDEEKYLKELARWMRVRLHIPANSTILTNMISYLKTNGTTQQTLPKAMFDALKATSTSTERGKRFATRDPAQMQQLTKDIIPIITPVISRLPNSARTEVLNFVLAKIVADNTINDPAEIVKLAQDFATTLTSRSGGGGGGKDPNNIPVGDTVEYMNKIYTWTNNAWRSGTEVLTGSDAQSATQDWMSKP
jgi:hypothetical protein